MNPLTKQLEEDYAILLKVITHDFTIPLFISKVSCGFPSPAADYKEDFDLRKFLIKNESATFCMWADGDSMKDAGIQDGALLIVDKSLSPKSGDIVVAGIYDDHTVKYFQRVGNNVILCPANPKYKPIQVTPQMELDIFGVVISNINLFRK